MARVCALTTIDNPYDPIEDFEAWYRFDMDKGHGSLQYLARIAHWSEAFTDEENDKETERAIDEIIKYDFMNIFKKHVANLED